MVQDGLEQETGRGMVSSFWSVINPQGLQKNTTHKGLADVTLSALDLLFHQVKQRNYTHIEK